MKIVYKNLEALMHDALIKNKDKDGVEAVVRDGSKYTVVCQQFIMRYETQKRGYYFFGKFFTKRKVMVCVGMIKNPAYCPGSITDHRRLVRSQSHRL